MPFSEYCLIIQIIYLLIKEEFEIVGCKIYSHKIYVKTMFYIQDRPRNTNAFRA